MMMTMMRDIRIMMSEVQRQERSGWWQQDHHDKTVMITTARPLQQDGDDDSRNVNLRTMMSSTMAERWCELECDVRMVKTMTPWASWHDDDDDRRIVTAGQWRQWQQENDVRMSKVWTRLLQYKTKYLSAAVLEDGLFSTRQRNGQQQTLVRHTPQHKMVYCETLYSLWWCEQHDEP